MHIYSDDTAVVGHDNNEQEVSDTQTDVTVENCFLFFILVNDYVDITL